jgi:hypothetical protein
MKPGLLFLAFWLLNHTPPFPGFMVSCSNFVVQGFEPTDLDPLYQNSLVLISG